MSTTVSYKGSTIATLSNETKTLTTAGTWVEGDIVITDAGGTAAISVVDTTDSHGGTIREITALDISDTTAVASDVASGKYFYTASGVKTAGTGSGSSGESSSYTRTTIASEQTVTPITTTSNGDTYYSAQLNMLSGLESGEEYIITYNGTEYFYTCRVLWGNTYLLGEINYFYGTTGLPYPFGILWTSGTTCRMACGDSTAVTVKIEKLEFVGTPSATAHTIYFEFTDNTNTTITAYYDNSFISNAITATIPRTYGNKTVGLAQLDGVTWYNPANIPLNTQLVDYNEVIIGYGVDEYGNIVNTGQSWDVISDYIPIDPSMTFTFKTNKWYNVGFYNSSKNMVRIVSGYDIETSSSNETSTGTLNSSNIPSTAAYIILSGNSYDLQNTMSLIRTA